MLNPSLEQERQWAADRAAALARHKQAVATVLALPTVQARRKWLADYRGRMGDVCAEAMEEAVRAAWGGQRA